MQKFGFSDSVLDVAKAVLDKKKPEELEEAKMPRQMKDPKKETLMAYPYKPGKARVQVVDKKDVKDKEKKGYVHAEEVEEDAIGACPGRREPGQAWCPKRLWMLCISSAWASDVPSQVMTSRWGHEVDFGTCVKRSTKREAATVFFVT